MYYFKGIMKKGFDTKPIQQIISENEYSLFDVEKAKNKFSHSKNRGAKQAWKGGTCYAIAIFKDGSSIKLELSSNYGVYNILDNGCNYEITNDNILRPGRWEELIKK